MDEVRPQHGLEAAVRSGDDSRGVADRLGEAFELVRDGLGVLDHVGLHVDHARDERPAVGERVLPERPVLVAMAGVGSLDDEAAHVRLVEEIDHVVQCHVVVVGSGVVPPAGVHPNALARDALQRPVDGIDVGPDVLAELSDGGVLERDGERREEFGRVDL